MNSEDIEKTIPEEIRTLCYYRGPNGEEIPVFPYVIAVTGHRHGFGSGSSSSPRGFGEERLKDAFKRQLAGIARKWRETSKGAAPIVLLTGLADGADQIASEAALELDERLNVKVVAVLPMERDIFRLTVENQARFDRLLARAHYSFALPLDPQNVGREAELRRVVPETEETRQRQYVQLADFLALHSHVLFAFWDGIDNQDRGGTACVVRLKLQGTDESEERADFLTYSSVGPVVQLLTPRDNEADRAEPIDPNLKIDEVPVFFWSRENLWMTDEKSRAFPNRQIMTEARRLTTPAAQQRAIKSVLEKMGQLNADAAEHYAELEPKFAQAETYLWENKANPEANLDVGSRVLVDHYLVADQLALLFQERGQNIGRRRSRDGKKGEKDKVNGYPFWVALLCFLGGILGLLGEFEQESWHDPLEWGTLGAYWFAAAVIFVIYSCASKKKLHYRHFRSRAVAEALRVQIFWRIAGISDCVSCYYRSHQIDDSEWLRATVNGLAMLLPAPEPSGFDAKTAERLTFVRDVWAYGQLAYYEKRIAERRKSGELNWWERPWFAILLYFLVIGAGPLQSRWFACVYERSGNDLLVLLGIASIGVLEALAASFFVYQAMKKQLLCHKLESDRYERMILPYDRAVLLTKKKPLSAESEEYWRQIFRQLGAEAITENADWLLTVGERELLLPR